MRMKMNGIHILTLSTMRKGISEEREKPKAGGSK